MTRDDLAARLDRALADHPRRPVAVVDLDAFDTNAADLERRAAGTRLRLATKSLRVPALVRRVLGRTGWHGVLCFTLAEALRLHRDGVADDLLVAYPTVDSHALAELREDPDAARAVTLMVDDVAHLDLLDRVSVRRRRGPPVRVAFDLDAGLLFPRTRLGPRRSPLRSPTDVVRLARAAQRRPGVVVVGAMTYEGLVAGVPDDVPGNPPRTALLRALQAANLAQLRRRRRRTASALTRAGVSLELWNAGGTGSLGAGRDPVVTELAAGSGLLAPALFDHYRDLDPEPACFLGVPVTRRPDDRTATVHGGGWVASGAAGPDRLPVPWAPAGLALTTSEGAGEVQTPLVGPGARRLRVGDTVWFRHAKAGEAMEHVAEVLLVRGGHLVGSAPTYRGLGLCF